MKHNTIVVLENAGWPVLLVDTAGTILQANLEAIRTFGLPAHSGASRLAAIWSPENGASVEQFLAQWSPSSSSAVTVRLRVAGGRTLAYSATVCSTIKDGPKVVLLQLLPIPAAADEAKGGATEASLLHKQKLDCALQLARTVAMDFNNALTSILGHTSLLLSKADVHHPWRHSLIEVEKSASKAAEIANDLAVFSRQEKEIRSQTDGNLNNVLQRCVELFQHAAPIGIAWDLRLENHLFAAKFDEAKIQQALLKILENGVEALPIDGQITVQTHNLELAAPTQDRNVHLTTGTYVCAEIADNGRGIEPEVLPRIFEPFFTTKPAPHRGLGLVLAYGIVSNHGGGVAVSSQPKVGTSVRVYLPAVNKFVKETASPGEDLTGTETVLMVDDEDLLLTLGETVLTEYGYHVLTANSGAKALEIVSQTTTPIDLVVTDLVMPAMSGRELVERLRQVSPATRVLCTSGYVGPASLHESGTYLQKPFTSQELLIKVKRVLGMPPVTAG